ncbi:MAG: hypothetical protein ABSH32_11165 [Bryobacteraceae bacterium]|jgi:hypothetical protein
MRIPKVAAGSLVGIGILELSKSTTSTALDISEWSLLVFGTLLTIGLIGEYSESPTWKRREKVFEMLVIIGVAGEIFADGGIFLFSRRLQVIAERDVALLNVKASAADERSRKAEAHLADALASAESAKALVKGYDKQIADEKARAAAAELAAAEAKREEAELRVKLLDTFGSRHLSNTQIERVAHRLTGLSGVQVDVYVQSTEYPWIRDECTNLARQIARALAKAQIDSAAWLDTTSCVSATGVVVGSVPGNKTSEAAASEIRNALVPEVDTWPHSENLLPCPGLVPLDPFWPNKRSPNANIQIIVGRGLPKFATPESLGLPPKARK